MYIIIIYKKEGKVKLHNCIKKYKGSRPSPTRECDFPQETNLVKAELRYKYSRMHFLLTRIGKIRRS